MTHWHFEQDATGRGVIEHRAYPRFRANWTSGAAKEAAPLEPFWSDASSSEDDCLHLYGLSWIDNPPDSKTVERLMQKAAKVIDEWIASRL